MPGDDPSEDTTEQSEPETFTELSEDKQDELRATVETDPSDTDFKQVKDLLETGEDYVSLAGECLNSGEHEGEVVGAKLTKDGIIRSATAANTRPTPSRSTASVKPNRRYSTPYGTTEWCRLRHSPRQKTNR
jgi:hypothetical protein